MVAEVWQALHAIGRACEAAKGWICWSGHHLGKVRAERPLIKAFLNIADTNLVMVALTNGYNGILHVIPTIKGGHCMLKCRLLVKNGRRLTWEQIFFGAPFRANANAGVGCEERGLPV